MPKDNLLHEIAVTVIIVRDGKYLITRRSPSRKRFPGKWVVPGGRFEVDDYVNTPQDTKNGQWYNVLEKAARREVTEEVGLSINNIEYVTSIAVVHGDGAPQLIISLMADWESGEVILQEEELDQHKWVTLKEAKEFDFIEGVYDELVMAEEKKKGVKSEWKKHD